MSYTNTYYPDYEKMYPGVKLTPEVLAALRVSDRQMRRFERELKTEGFEADNEKQLVRFIPSREDSYERLVEEECLQFADDEMSVEDMVEYLEKDAAKLPDTDAKRGIQYLPGTAWISAEWTSAGNHPRGSGNRSQNIPEISLRQ